MLRNRQTRPIAGKHENNSTIKYTNYIIDQEIQLKIKRQKRGPNVQYKTYTLYTENGLNKV